MAEIVRTATQVERQYTNDGDGPMRTMQVDVVVRGIAGWDASVIRDFVKGLDLAGAPGTALIERSDYGLTARWRERVDPPESPV
ncbi:hypothetical protein ACFO0M_10045 [Micromonospora mangrovi]|uniref:Uncharacterized protein n=2 Tax=Micromonospora TaxID=1873 RepID=A0AAU7M6A7_9ACTN